MTYDVLLIHDSDKFIARVSQWPDIVAEDETEKGVIAKIRNHIQSLLHKGKIVKLDVDADTEEHPWLKYAGMFSDDADWEAFQESITLYRQDADRHS